jgi:hypothetical protein
LRSRHNANITIIWPRQLQRLVLSHILLLSQFPSRSSGHRRHSFIVFSFYYHLVSVFQTFVSSSAILAAHPLQHQFLSQNEQIDRILDAALADGQRLEQQKGGTIAASVYSEYIKSRADELSLVLLQGQFSTWIESTGQPPWFRHTNTLHRPSPRRRPCPIRT